MREQSREGKTIGSPELLPSLLKLRTKLPGASGVCLRHLREMYLLVEESFAQGTGGSRDGRNGLGCLIGHCCYLYGCNWSGSAGALECANELDRRRASWTVGRGDASFRSLREGAEL